MTGSRVLDLLNTTQLQILGYQENQLTGPIGELTLNEVKLFAKQSHFEHIAFRDPKRPGRLWVENLKNGKTEPWRTYETAKLVNKLCPNLIENWENSHLSPVDWDMQYPPITTPSIHYCTVLEWLALRFPAAVVVWVELALTYENDLKIHSALEELYLECQKRCPHWTIVWHVLGI